MADKKKWTLIDTLIVIVVIVACAACYKMFSVKSVGGDARTIDVDILISNQDEGLADAMTIGDQVTVSLTEKDSGELKDLRVEPAEAQVYDSINGAYKNAPIDGRVDIYATVEMEVDETDYAFTAGSTIVQVGTKLPFRGKGYATEGYVIAINEED